MCRHVKCPSPHRFSSIQPWKLFCYSLKKKKISLLICSFKEITVPPPPFKDVKLRSHYHASETCSCSVMSMYSAWSTNTLSLFQCFHMAGSSLQTCILRKCSRVSFFFLSFLFIKRVILSFRALLSLSFFKEMATQDENMCFSIVFLLHSCQDRIIKKKKEAFE